MTFTFETSYRQTEGNRGVCELEDRPSIAVAPPPVFKGPKGHWSPEDLLLSAAESCYFLTLSFLLKQAKLELLEFESRAVGTVERRDGGLVFTKIVLYPKVRIDAPVEQVQELLVKAKGGCLVSRSLSCEVELEPEIL